MPSLHLFTCTSVKIIYAWNKHFDGRAFIRVPPEYYHNKAIICKYVLTYQSKPIHPRTMHGVLDHSLLLWHRAKLHSLPPSTLPPKCKVCVVSSQIPRLHLLAQAGARKVCSYVDSTPNFNWWCSNHVRYLRLYIVNRDTC